MSLKLVIRSLVLVILLVALGFLLRNFEFNKIIDKNWIDVYVGNTGLEGRFLSLIHI